jgi:phenylpropionate dioxygenase-like ring-hydroxylating dioxygenase large terminal subunit
MSPEEPQELEPGLVEHEKGLVSARIFAEEEIYKLELQNVFGRCWLYVGHESQVANPGDFVFARMGEEAVIFCRSHTGQLHAFLNMCPACSTLLTKADNGKLKEFDCVYHGWKFDLDGHLLVADESKGGELVPVDDLMLIAVPQLDSYKGMVFATFDAEAPPLETFLGDIRWGLDMLLEQGDMRVSSVTKWSAKCNWKFAAEVSVSDIYHGLVHMAALHADREIDKDRELDMERTGFTIITEYGHGLNAEYLDDSVKDAEDLMQQWRQDPANQRRLGQFRMNVHRSAITLFPNAMVSPSTRELHLWHPRGVAETEIWMVTFYDAAEPPETRQAFQRWTQLRHGPGGMYSQDEAENWEQATKSAQGFVTSMNLLNYQMGLGHGEIIDDEQSPPRIETLINEHRQLWFYRNWALAVSAPNWSEWQERLPKPTGRV